jgi:HEPN domain-containing protein
MTKKQKFKKEYAKELLKIALTDLESASLLHGTRKARPETIVFHVQQSIEKSIKAVTCHLEIPILMLHDIGALLGSLPEDKLPPYEFDLTKFNDYAGILRYEEGSAVLSTADIDKAIEVGREVWQWAKEEINK